MITTNLVKLIVSFNAFLSLLNIEQSTNIIEVNEAAHAPIAVESKTYMEDFLIYPQVKELKDEGVQNKINETLIKHIKSSYEGYLLLKKEMEKFKEDEKDQCKEYPYSCEYSYNTRFDVKFNQNGKLSIILYDATYSGGAHGLEGVKTYNFNVHTGEVYTLKDIISNEAKFKSLTEYAKKYMQEHQEIFFDEEIIGDFEVNEQTQFYFTESGIDLIFQQYEVASYAAGHPTISIPSSEL